MPDAGHTIDVEFPEDLADIVDEFLTANQLPSVDGASHKGE